MRILLSIVFNAIALYATALVVPRIPFDGTVGNLLAAGAIFGLFNLIVRPVAMLLSLPLLIVTLGLFYFVLNGILLWVASFFLPGYHVAGLVAGILGSLVFAVVNWALHALFGAPRLSGRRRLSPASQLARCGPGRPPRARSRRGRPAWVDAAGNPASRARCTSSAARAR